MASIKRHGSRWRAQVYVRGRRDSGVFATKAEAAAWALEREAEIAGRKAYTGTVADVLRKYASDVSPTHRGERWERTRLARLERDPLAAVPLASLTPAEIATWRDRRLRVVSGASVRREFVLITSALEVARREWGWIRTNPARDVKKPPSPPSRKRRIPPDEIDRLMLAFGLGDGLRANTAMQRTGLAFLFALETAMRAGEILALTETDVHLRERYVRVAQSKNGDARDVPLSSAAIKILKALPDHVFAVDPGTRDVLFRRAKVAAEIPDLHFHDARAEAIWRLSRKLDPLELARVVGHRDLRSIMLYYRPTVSELATRLG
ncbi:MAG TPA: site-specific integrase [Rhodanobacteraceae bacterium]|nr:site-specific integrase [Rhodanobacteraceae bacterium]